MKNAQKPDHISLSTLIGRMREGRFVIPDFQREFEWKPWDIRDLIRSVFRDYYIGSLLLWKGKEENFRALSCEPVYGYDGDSSRSEYIVLDGQQRLTALYYALVAPDVVLPNRANRAVYTINVEEFMQGNHDDAFDYDWCSRRMMKILRDPMLQYANHLFPLSVIGAGGWELPGWAQGYEHYWTEAAKSADQAGDEALAAANRNHAENARSFGIHLRELTQEYQISYIELDQDLALDKVCDIFTQINSRGVRLDIFDLMNALMKPRGLQLKHMWRDASERLAFAESEKMNVYILQVMSILRQSYCSPNYLYFLLPGTQRPIRNQDGSLRKDVLIETTEDFESRWTQAVDALERAMRLLRHPQEFGVISSRYLPYVTILPVFAALQTYVQNSPPDTRLDAQRKVRHWYWASVFLNRYSGSVESTSARDFIDLQRWVENDADEPPLINDFKQRFRTLDLRREVKRGSSVYNGIFNLLVLQGARDWVTGNLPQHDDLDDHHIVPHSWGVEHLGGSRINTILNRTPLTAETNRHVISSKLPNQYLPDMIARNGEKAVLDIMETHFISRAAMQVLLRDPFTPDDFDEFISERQRTLQDAIENLLVKERFDLPPNLRRLDTAIEEVELRLREVINGTLEGNPERIPPHVLNKVNERLSGAAKKNATIDLENYQALDRKLEYFDLRELQDTILGKSVWSEFQARFVNKEGLMAKFSQLAELRNSIRHSRQVDNVTAMEGEAAVVWFGQVLDKS